MDRKNLWIAGGLIGFIICFVSAFMIISFALNLAYEMDDQKISNSSYLSFNNSTPKATAISIARLNLGVYGFKSTMAANASLTHDGKYWIVKMHDENVTDDWDAENYSYLSRWEVTVDSKTWMSKKRDVWQPDDISDNHENTWRSLDELKSIYIADIQHDVNHEFVNGYGAQKITMGGKEIWKVTVGRHIHYIFGGETGGSDICGYVYVDPETGKSKNTVDDFNHHAGTNGWLTLKEVDDAIYQIYYFGPTPFKDALRDLYPEKR